MRTSIIAAVAALSVSACALTQSQWTAAVDKVQSDFVAIEPDISSDLAAFKASPKTVAQVTADETAINNALTTLASVPSPANVSAAAADGQALLNDIPQGDISPAHLIEAQAFLASVQGLSAFLPQSASASTAAPGDGATAAAAATPSAAAAAGAPAQAAAGVSPDASQGTASAVPYLVWKSLEGATFPSSVIEALGHQSAAGLVFTLDWSAVQPNCGASSFAALSTLAGALRADQVIYGGIGGGERAPACLAKQGIKFASLYQGFMSKDGDAPCTLRSLPDMANPDYGAAFVAEERAFVAALAKFPVKSGGTLATRFRGLVLAAYASDDNELVIEGNGCSDGKVDQTAAEQAAIWQSLGYTSTEAFDTYTSVILDGVMSDPNLPDSAIVLQNVMGSENQSFPQVVGATPVLAPIMAYGTAKYGSRFVLSWNEVSELSTIPSLVVTAAQAGAPLMLQFNGTATGYVTSCDGILPNGHKDMTPANASCFAAMQSRFLALIPPASNGGKLVAWQVWPGDWSTAKLLP